MNPSPALLGELLRIAADSSASLDECRELLDAHPLPAGEILRVGNSELCGLPGRIHRLDRVVHVLGPRVVAEIATWVWVEHSTRGGLERWEHALGVGTCARLLARLTCCTWASPSQEKRTIASQIRLNTTIRVVSRGSS